MNKRLKTREEIELWLFQMKIEKYKINDDLTVDVNGYVDISNQHLTIIPIQFGRVEKHFFCYSNKLTNLKGSPKYVGGTFACEDNYLTTLVGAPEEVGEDFDCHFNDLVNLDYMPKIIGGEFNYSENPLTETALKNVEKSVIKQAVNDINFYETQEEIKEILESAKLKIKA
jgi:hypothetical protein